ncbi:MAG: heavy-metal-associated domain-containing protein [Desulfonatronovibrionaceae bacterium]
MKYTVRIEGMSCEHCVRAVAGALQTLEGVQDVSVHLEKKQAEFTASQSLDMARVKKAIQGAGYTVVD